MAKQSPAEALAAYRQAQDEEYGTYVATDNIPLPGSTSLAYRKGFPVPVSNVDTDGRVILERHVCNDDCALDYPDGDCPDRNKPLSWGEADLVQKVKPTKAAKAATTTTKGGGN